MNYQYRIWDSYLGKILYVLELNYIPEGFDKYNNLRLRVDYIRALDTEKHEIHVYQGAELDEIVLERCTQKQDKNGRLFYDGDIIKTEKGNYQEIVDYQAEIGEKGEKLVSQFSAFPFGYNDMELKDIVTHKLSKTDEIVGEYHTFKLPKGVIENG